MYFNYLPPRVLPIRSAISMVSSGLSLFYTCSTSRGSTGLRNAVLSLAFRAGTYSLSVIKTTQQHPVPIIHLCLLRSTTDNLPDSTTTYSAVLSCELSLPSHCAVHREVDGPPRCSPLAGVSCWHLLTLQWWRRPLRQALVPVRNGLCGNTFWPPIRCDGTGSLSQRTCHHRRSGCHCQSMEIVGRDSSRVPTVKRGQRRCSGMLG